MKSTTKEASLRPNKSYCTKHSLFHGKKYKSCSPEESVEDILFGITGHKSTYQNKRVKVYSDLAKKVGEYKGMPVYSDPSLPDNTLILTNLPVERVIKKTRWTEGDIAIIPSDCACNVHRTNDPEGKQIPCLGHGLPCPCTIELLKKISTGEVQTDPVLVAKGDIKESPEMPPEASK